MSVEQFVSICAQNFIALNMEFNIKKKSKNLSHQTNLKILLILQEKDNIRPLCIFSFSSTHVPRNWYCW